MADTGRPSGYSESIADEICWALSQGTSLRALCDIDGMPAIRTVFGWLEKHESFRTKYARARENQADVMDAKILEVADECTEETAHSSKVKIGAYQWRATKLAPKKYGERTQLEHTGAEGGPLVIKWADAPKAGK